MGCIKEPSEPVFAIVSPLTVKKEEKLDHKSRIAFQYALVGGIKQYNSDQIQSIVDQTMCSVFHDSIVKYAIAEYDFVYYPDSSYLIRALRPSSEWSNLAKEKKYIAEFAWENGIFKEKQSYSLTNNDFSSQWYHWSYDCQ
jgi:hypothetical protein